MKQRLFILGLMALISGCTNAGAPGPLASKASNLKIAPAKLVLNLPPDGTGQAPFPSSGTFRVNEGEAQAGTWTVENPAVAAIDANGVVTAIATGSTLVWLEAGKPTARASASLEVVDRGGLGEVALQ